MGKLPLSQSWETRQRLGGEGQAVEFSDTLGPLSNQFIPIPPHGDQVLGLARVEFDFLA